MSKKYTIRPIPISISGNDLSRYTYRMGVGIGCINANYTWYIEGASSNILIDTGFTAEKFREYGWLVPKYDIQTPEQGLAKLNLKPEDIDLVVVTHLHFDHIGMGYLYTKAKFLVPRRELEQAQTLIQWDPYNYLPRAWKELDFQLVEEDYQIEEGIRTILTPGHAWCGQAVAVDTVKGTAIIDSMCSQWENYYPYSRMYQPEMKYEEDQPPDPEVAIPAPRSGTNEECYESLIRIKREADILIPVHDPRFICVDRIPSDNGVGERPKP